VAASRTRSRRTKLGRLAAAVSVLALAACSGPASLQRVEFRPPVVDVTASDSPSPSPTPSPSASPTRSPASPPRSIADYLAMLPTFPPAPAPIAVDLPHAAGRAAWISRIPTSQPVAFLTIDDGAVKSPAAIALMRAAGIPVTLFLTTNIISDNKPYFAQLQDLGAVIEDHTISHPELINLDYAHQRNELCHSADLLGSWYGRRPVIFRPPYGDKNDDTLRAAWDCGLKAGFFWKETVDKGKVRYQTALHKVQPGDIILMHFRPAFADDFVAALKAIKDAGLTPALLEDYVLIN
jgi:peptidoglycan/xylan/chitin deacetylase (PgdA/CDA1 family)